MATEAQTDFSQTPRAYASIGSSSAADPALEIDVGGGTDYNAPFGDRRTHGGGRRAAPNSPCSLRGGRTCAAHGRVSYCWGEARRPVASAMGFPRHDQPHRAANNLRPPVRFDGQAQDGRIGASDLEDMDFGQVGQGRRGSAGTHATATSSTHRFIASVARTLDMHAASATDASPRAPTPEITCTSG